MKSAVAYIRCSTEMQEDSPDQQKKAIEEFALRKGYSILEYYIDFGKSGTTFAQRSEFLRLKSTVEKRPNFIAVICYDESRWGRAIDAEENTYWRVHFRMYGVDVLLVKTSVDRNNEFAPMLAAFEGVQASQYSKKLSELTLRGAKNNGIYSSGGTPPYGYKRIAVNTKTGNVRELVTGEWSISGQEKVRWAIGDPEEVKVVQEIFRQRSEGLGCFLIAQALNRQCVPCAKRGRWRNFDQKWSSGTIKTIVENPTYYGARIYNRNSMSKIQAQQKGKDLKHNVSYPHWRNEAKDWVIEENAHDAIITKEIWTKANTGVNEDRKKKYNGYSYKGRFLLTGILRCSRCGFPFQGCSSSVKNKKYEKYIDGGWKNKGICSHLGISKSMLEEFAIKAIKDVLIQPNLVAEIEAQLTKLLEAAPTSTRDEIERIKSLIAECEQKTKHITNAIENGGAIQSLFERLKALEEEKGLLNVRLQSLSLVNERQIEPAKISEIVAKFILNFEEKFENAPIEEKKLLIKKMISEIVVDRDNGVVRFYVRRVPAVSPELEKLYEKKRVPAGVASTQSSGGPNFTPLTDLQFVCEMEY